MEKKMGNHLSIVPVARPIYYKADEPSALMLSQSHEYCNQLSKLIGDEMRAIQSNLSTYQERDFSTVDQLNSAVENLALKLINQVVSQGISITDEQRDDFEYIVDKIAPKVTEVFFQAIERKQKIEHEERRIIWETRRDALKLFIETRENEIKDYESKFSLEEQRKNNDLARWKTEVSVSLKVQAQAFAQFVELEKLSMAKNQQANDHEIKLLSHDLEEKKEQNGHDLAQQKECNQFKLESNKQEKAYNLESEKIKSSERTTLFIASEERKFKTFAKAMDVFGGPISTWLSPAKNESPSPSANTLGKS